MNYAKATASTQQSYQQRVSRQLRDDIKPRENVFTFEAWKALGRYVRKGEKGVQVLTFIERKDKDTGAISRRPWRTTVFHISQTESIN